MSTPEKHSVRFQRANFVVNCLEESYKFYCGVLGMSLTFQKNSEADSYSYDVFEIDKKHKLRFAILSTPSQPRIMALTELPDLNHYDISLPRRSAIVLDISDIDSVVDAARKLGLTVYSEDKLETHDGRFGREVGIVDVDGNLVVIYHIPATK